MRLQLIWFNDAMSTHHMLQQASFDDMNAILGWMLLSSNQILYNRLHPYA